ncbi:TPA: hypothetical protein JLC00_004096 [Escherichia coli]|nr:hypothetical protein [Escherichia coli]
MSIQYFDFSDPDVLKAALKIGEVKYHDAMSSLNRQEDDVYRAAIKKEFGAFTEENARKCRLIIANDGTKHLTHMEKFLCTVYPPKQDRFLGSSAQVRVNLSVDYRIY